AECTLMEYSSKSVAVFGNTRPIREKLKKMGGAFNSRLKYQGVRAAGWIFSKAYEQELAVFFGLD
ncbi:MAG: fusion protein, partial [Bacteroidales bacterium]